MRPLAHGRPGSRIIPAGWGAAHAPTAEQTMGSAEISLRKPDIHGAFDSTLGRKPTTLGDLIYSGPARAVRVNEDQVTTTGEQAATTLSYLVAVPLAVAARKDMVVRFAKADDPELLTARFVVSAVLKGSHAWERDLLCTEDQS